MNNSVDFVVRGILRTQVPVKGKAVAAENGLLLNYEITEDQSPLTKRGLQDTLIPWDDLAEGVLKKKMFKHYLYLRTKSIDPVTSNPRLHETEIWLQIAKEDREQAELVLLGRTDFDLKKGNQELEAEMDDIRDFLEGLNDLGDLDDLSDLPG